MTSAIAAAFLAGLMGSPHCVAMCGGFATACARPRRGLLAWHAGRLATYATLGALAGATGAAIPGPAWLPAAISIALLAWFAAALGGVAPQPSVRLPALARIGARIAARPGPTGRFLFGLTTGLLPCGMVYAALGIAVAAAHPAGGAAAMLAFGLGTVPALATLSAGVHRLAARSIWHRRALALLVLAAGLWSVGARVGASAHPGAGAAAGMGTGTDSGAGTGTGTAPGSGARAAAGLLHRHHAMPGAGARPTTPRAPASAGRADDDGRSRRAAPDAPRSAPPAASRSLRERGRRTGRHRRARLESPDRARYVVAWIALHNS